MAYRKKQSGSENRNRPSIIGFRATDDERARIEAAAKRLGLTVGSYVRLRALRKPETKATRRPHVEIAQLAQMLGMLGALGGRIQLMVKKHGAGDAVTESQLQEMMAALRIASEDIIHAMGKHPHLSQEIHHRIRHDH